MRLGSFLISDLVAATAAKAPDIRVVAGNLLGSVKWLLEKCAERRAAFSQITSRYGEDKDRTLR
jgi:hypothetical protein